MEWECGSGRGCWTHRTCRTACRLSGGTSGGCGRALGRTRSNGASAGRAGVVLALFGRAKGGGCGGLATACVQVWRAVG